MRSMAPFFTTAKVKKIDYQDKTFLQKKIYQKTITRIIFFLKF